MKLNKYVSWLKSELPKLVSNNVVSSEVAKNLEEYYTKKVEEKNNMGAALSIFSVMGAACLGLGIILLFAVGWSDFSISQKTIVSFLPLIVSLAFISWSVIKEKTNMAIREGGAIFNILAMGACIAMISRVYHIPGEFDTFLLTWSILSIPLIYLLSSSTAAIAYLSGVVAWSLWGGFNYYGYMDSSSLWIWALFIPFAPYYWSKLKENRYSRNSICLSTFAIIALGLAMLSSLQDSPAFIWILSYSSYCTVLYLISKLYFSYETGVTKTPFKNFGALGNIIILYIFTFSEIAEELADIEVYGETNPAIFMTIASFILLATAMFLFYKTIKDKPKDRVVTIPLGISPIIVVLAYVLSTTLGGGIASTLISLYLFALGGLIIFYGGKNEKIGLINQGIMLSGLIIFSKFIDSGIELMGRSLIFMAIGAALISVNIIYSKKLKRKGA